MDKPQIKDIIGINFLTMQGYERYLPSAFDESLSILQKINKIIKQLNDFGIVAKNLIENWNELYNWIVGEGLEETVNKIIEEKINDGSFDELFNNIVGSLSDLDTDNKENVVSAINEIFAIAIKNRNDIGNIADLTTVNKENLVQAIDELVLRLGIIEGDTKAIGESTGGGVISGFKVKQQNVLSMAVDVGVTNTPNIIHMKSGIRYELPNISIAVDDADPILNRVDVVYVSKDGEILLQKGISAVNPLPPVISPEHELLAYVNVLANDTVVNNSDIIDKRSFKGLAFLNTVDKGNLVAAINEVKTNLIESVGDLTEKIDILESELTNEISQEIENIVLEIVSINSSIDNINDEIDDILSKIITLQSDLDDVNDKIGDLTELLTNNKTNLVDSINEVYTKIDELKMSKPYVDVKDFGAVGDGIANDSNAIELAIASAKLLKLPLFFSKGEYLYNKNILINGEIKKIYGDGSATLKGIGMDYVGFSIRNTVGLSINNLKFTGDLENETTMMWIENNKNLTMTDCDYIDTGSTCISLSKNENVTITTCYFYNTGLTAKTNPSHPSKPAIWVGEAPLYTNENIHIVDCIFDETNWSGVYMFAQTGTIRDCIFESCGESSVFVDYNPENISIVNNTINNSTAVNIAGFGLELGGVKRCLIDGNTITNCDESGIAVAVMSDFTITNNKCINNGKGIGVPEQKSGLVFRLATSDNVRGIISGNIFTDTRQTTESKTQLYGISSNRYDNVSTHYVADTIITNNYLRGNKNSAIQFYDEAVFLGDNVLLGNNVGYGDKPTTIIVDSGTTTGLRTFDVGFRPRAIRIESFTTDYDSKSVSEITMNGAGVCKNIVVYHGNMEVTSLAWVLKDENANILTYAEMAGIRNNGFAVNIGYAQVTVKLMITAYP